MPTLKRPVKSGGPTQSRDAEATRNKILDAAEEEFAQNGLLGARTEAIAARTGVTKTMIFYYFKSKEALYEAVLERTFGDRIKAAQQINVEVNEPKEALMQLIEGFLHNAGSNPNIPAILFYEAMQNKGKYYKQIGVVSVYGVLAEVLERGVRSGVFRTLDSHHAAVNIIGMCAFYFCAHENIKHFWPGKEMLGTEMVAQHKSEVLKMVMAGVLNQ